MADGNYVQPTIPRL